MKKTRGSLLILDRTFDLISPVVHDFFYQTNVVDIKDGVNEDGAVKVENKMVYLSDQDELWVKLRNMHFLESFNYVNEQVQSIVDTSKTDTSKLALKDMAEMMRKLPKQQEMMRGYKIHVDLLNRVTTNLQNNKISKIVDLEQQIVSGLKNSLSVDKIEQLKISNTALVKLISQTSKEL